MAEKYAYCKLKNIATLNKIEATESPFYIDLVSHLPNDCIRLNTGAKVFCEVCNECGWKTW